MQIPIDDWTIWSTHTFYAFSILALETNTITRIPACILVILSMIIRSIVLIREIEDDTRRTSYHSGAFYDILAGCLILIQSDDVQFISTRLYFINVFWRSVIFGLIGFIFCGWFFFKSPFESQDRQLTTDNEEMQSQSTTSNHSDTSQEVEDIVPALNPEFTGMHIEIAMPEELVDHQSTIRSINQTISQKDLIGWFKQFWRGTSGTSIFTKRHIINQTTNQAINQTTNQATNQTTNQSIDQSEKDKKEEEKNRRSRCWGRFGILSTLLAYRVLVSSQNEITGYSSVSESRIWLDSALILSFLVFIRSLAFCWVSQDSKICSHKDSKYFYYFKIKYCFKGSKSLSLIDKLVVATSILTCRSVRMVFIFRCILRQIFIRAPELFNVYQMIKELSLKKALMCFILLDIFLYYFSGKQRDSESKAHDVKDFDTNNHNLQSPKSKKGKSKKGKSKKGRPKKGKQKKGKSKNHTFRNGDSNDYNKNDHISRDRQPDHWFTIQILHLCFHLDRYDFSFLLMVVIAFIAILNNV